MSCASALGPAALPVYLIQNLTSGQALPLRHRPAGAYSYLALKHAALVEGTNDSAYTLLIRTVLRKAMFS